MSTETFSLIPSQELDLNEEFDVQAPDKPPDSSAKKITDYFFAVKDVAVTMYPLSERPIRLPSVDFFFSPQMLLHHHYEEGKGRVQRTHLLTELNSTPSRIYNWQNENAPLLKDKFLEQLKEGKKIAYICCHGWTYGEPEDKWWGLATTDEVAHGADRIVRALIAEDKYDLIVITACNPDGLPLAVEESDEPHPKIIRFTMNNSFQMIGDEEPITFIPAKE